MKFKILLWVILPFLFLSCHDDFEETESHTVLVYMVGDNSLYGNVSSDMKEMRDGYAKIGSPDKNNLLVYTDKYDTPVLIRIKIKDGEAVNDTIQRYSEMNSCDADILENVFDYVQSNFKADHYGLVLWSHGSGSRPASLAHVKSFGWDHDNIIGDSGSNNATTMDIPDLKTSLLSCGVSLDYILFDACEMQTIEVAYELRNCANYIIASPWDISAYGGPYDKIIPHCFSSDANLNIPFSIANDFYNYYYDEGEENVGVMMSVVKTDEMENLAKETKEVFSNYLTTGESINTSDVFSYDDYSKNYFYDFKSFIISQIKNKYNDYENSDDYKKWSAAFDAAVPVYKYTDKYKIVISPTNYSTHDSKGSEEEGSNGISTYIFNDQNFSDKYDDNWKIYEWYSAAGWKEAGY